MYAQPCHYFGIYNSESGSLEQKVMKNKIKRKKYKLAEVHYPGEKFMSISKIKHIYSCNFHADRPSGTQLHPALKQATCQKRESCWAATWDQSGICRVTANSLVLSHLHPHWSQFGCASKITAEQDHSSRCIYPNGTYWIGITHLVSWKFLSRCYF